jgi:hypothetical protein
MRCVPTLDDTWVRVGPGPDKERHFMVMTEEVADIDPDTQYHGIPNECNGAISPRVRNPKLLTCPEVYRPMYDAVGDCKEGD